MSASQPTYEELRAENAALRQRVAELEAQLARLTTAWEQAQRAGKRQAAPFRQAEQPRPDPKPPGRKPGDAYGTHDRRTAPPVVHATYDVPLPDRCPHCAHPAVRPTGVATQYQSEVVGQVLHRCFRLHQGQCSQCGGTVQGRHPLQTSDATGAAAVQLGAHTHALLTWLHKRLGLACGKVVTLLDQVFGLRLSRATVARSVQRTARRLAPAHAQLQADLRASSWVVPDETGWRIGGTTAWLHGAVGPDATCYQLDRRRHHEPLQRLLGPDWDGTLVHDGWAAYDRLTAAHHQQCLAHLLRRCREARAVVRGAAVRWVQRLLTTLQAVVQQRRDFVATPADLETRLDTALDLGQRLEVAVAGRVTHPALGRLARFVRRHLWACLRCVVHPEVDATNWRAEQALRPAVVNRKVWGGNRTDAGAAAQGVVMSVMQTCVQRGHDALAFLRAALCSPTPVLLPASGKQ